jgi:hypothetical protein
MKEITRGLQHMWTTFDGNEKGLNLMLLITVFLTDV